MQKLEITGGKKISGTITISGSKNATLPILAATILTDKKIIISNVPIVRDVETMVALLGNIGSTIKLHKNAKKIIIHNKKPIKTWSRKSTIIPDFVGLSFLIHNGKKFISITISEDMVGHKLGEFSPTRQFFGHTPADKKAKMVSEATAKNINEKK